MRQEVIAMIDFLKSKYDRLEGCSIDEIDHLEKHYAIELPEVYRAFLLLMGRNAENYEVGSEFQYRHLFDLKNDANDLLIQNNQMPLSQNAFVFWMHQGYQFCYFYSDIEVYDPNVYYFNECYKSEDHGKIICSLSKFLCFPEAMIGGLLLMNDEVTEVCFFASRRLVAEGP